MNIRWCSAIVLIAISAFSVAQGVSLVRFSVALKSIGSGEGPAETIRAWTDVPGVASEALKSQLKKQIDPSDKQGAVSRRDTLAKMLSVRPLSALDWLLLSGMQLMTDQPMEQVFGTLMLSAITGPNEGYVMADRGIFEISLWETLPPDLRRRAAMDLTAEEVIRRKDIFRNVLSTKSVGVRNEIRTAIFETGLPPQEVERRVGF